MPDILQNLNPAQREAVTATEGYIRVIAGAGSGKTRALTHRFAFLVNELGVLPGRILCVTFTNKSANEMRQRIHNLTGDNDTGYIGTFHAFCVTVLQEDSHAVGYPRSFLVLDNEDINAMDDRSVQRFVRDCDPRDLVLALKAANEEVSKKLLSNMSTRMAQNIRDDLEITTNVRMKDVEDAQQRIVDIIRDLEEKNEIVIAKGGKDDIIA